MGNIIIERERFGKALLETINGAALPAFVKLDVLRTCEAELVNLARAQYEQAVAAQAKADEQAAKAEAEAEQTAEEG